MINTTTGCIKQGGLLHPAAVSFFLTHKKGTPHMRKKFMLRRTHGFSPDILIPLLNKKHFPENRTGEIINFIESNAVETDNAESVLYLCEKNKNTLYKIQTVKENNTTDTYYAGWSHALCGVAIITITEYDNQYSMLFSTYDGSESLTSLQCVNDDLNVWQ